MMENFAQEGEMQSNNNGSQLVMSNLPLFGFGSEEEGVLQCSLELLHNSIDALITSGVGNSNPALEVSFTCNNQEPKTLQLAVSDNGSGIDSLDTFLKAFTTTKIVPRISGANPMLQDYAQTGRFGIGLSACLMYSYMKTGKEMIVVTRSRAENKAIICSFRFDPNSGEAKLVNRIEHPHSFTSTRIQVELPWLSQASIAAVQNALIEWLERYHMLPSTTITTCLGVDNALFETGSGAGGSMYSMTYSKHEYRGYSASAGLSHVQSSSQYEQALHLRMKEYYHCDDEGACNEIHVKTKFSEEIEMEGDDARNDNFSWRVSAVLFTQGTPSTPSERDPLIPPLIPPSTSIQPSALLEYGGVLNLEICRSFSGVPVLDTATAESESCAISTTIRDFPWKKYGHVWKQRGDRWKMRVNDSFLTRPSTQHLVSVRRKTGSPIWLSKVPTKLLLFVDFIGHHPPYSNLRKSSLLPSKALVSSLNRGLTSVIEQLRSVDRAVETIFLSSKEEKVANVVTKNIPRVAMDIVRMAKLASPDLQDLFCRRLEIDPDISTEADCAAIIERRILTGFRAKTAVGDGEEEEEEEEVEEEEEGIEEMDSPQAEAVTIPGCDDYF